MYGEGEGPDGGRTSATGSAGPDPGYGGGGGEVVPRETEPILIRPGELPEPAPFEVRLPVPAPAPARTVVVRRRTVLYLILILLILLVLLLLLALIVYAKVIKPQPANVGATSSATSTASTTATASPKPTAASTSPAPGVSTSAGTPTASPTASGTAGSAANAAVPPGGTFSPPDGSQYLGGPVDGGVNYPVDVAINAVDYPNSVTFGCSTSGLIDWNVAGFATFEAYIGIPDDAQNATGVTDELIFKDQNGKTLDTVKTAIGQPRPVSFSLAGTERLAVSCIQQGATSPDGNLVALGSASISN